MTREHSILMLLAAGPASRGQLVQDTGWGIVETNTVLDRLVAAGQVVPYPGTGSKRHGAVILCLPKTRDEAMKQRHVVRTQQVLAAVHRHRAARGGAWA